MQRYIANFLTCCLEGANSYQMKTEKEKMLARELYDALDKQLSDEPVRTRLLLKKLNDIPEDETEARNQILKELIPNAGLIFGYNLRFIAIMEAIL